MIKQAVEEKGKAYIPLQRETTRDPQFTQHDSLYTQRDHLSTQHDPNASRWNIGPIGARVGHVHLMLFASISFALGSHHKRGFQWNMDFKLRIVVRTGGNSGNIEQDKVSKRHCRSSTDV